MTRPQPRQTHTYAILEISAAAFAEIEGKLREAQYLHLFHEGPEGLVIDMAGIAVKAEEKEVTT